MLLCCMCVLVYVVGSGYDFNHLPVTIGSLSSMYIIRLQESNEGITQIWYIHEQLTLRRLNLLGYKNGSTYANFDLRNVNNMFCKVGPPKIDLTWVNLDLSDFVFNMQGQQYPG